MSAVREEWHLDKRVPIALIFTLAVQTGSGIWWAASMNERMAQIERSQFAQVQRTERSDAVLADQGQRIAVLTEAISNTNRNIERLQTELSDTNSLLREMLVKSAVKKAEQ